MSRRHVFLAAHNSAIQLTFLFGPFFFCSAFPASTASGVPGHGGRRRRRPLGPRHRRDSGLAASPDRRRGPHFPSPIESLTANPTGPPFRPRHRSVPTIPMCERALRPAHLHGHVWWISQDTGDQTLRVEGTGGAGGLGGQTGRRLDKPGEEMKRCEDGHPFPVCFAFPACLAFPGCFHEGYPFSFPGSLPYLGPLFVCTVFM